MIFGMKQRNRLRLTTRFLVMSCPREGQLWVRIQPLVTGRDRTEAVTQRDNGVTIWINTQVEAIPKGFRVGMDHTLD